MIKFIIVSLLVVGLGLLGGSRVYAALFHGAFDEGRYREWIDSKSSMVRHFHGVFTILGFLMCALSLLLMVSYPE